MQGPPALVVHNLHRLTVRAEGSVQKARGVSAFVTIDGRAIGQVGEVGHAVMAAVSVLVQQRLSSIAASLADNDASALRHLERPACMVPKLGRALTFDRARNDASAPSMFSP